MVRRQHLRVERHEGTAPRKKQGGGGGLSSPAGRDKKEFAKAKLMEFDNLRKKQQDRRAKLGKYIDPSLIFELRTNQTIANDNLASALGAMGARILAAPADDSAPWIVFANDDAREEFVKRLEKYAADDGAKFLEAVDGLYDVDPIKKVGPRLSELEAGDTDMVTIDVELWGINQQERGKAMNGIAAFVDEHGGNFFDALERPTFTLLRLKVPYVSIWDLAEFPEVAFVDLPHAPAQPVDIDIPARDLEFGGPPSKGAPGILVIDSGVVSGHPALENCVLDERSFMRDEEDPADDEGHGTMVASIAAHGNIAAQIEKGVIEPTHWILSAKVGKMDNGHHVLDDTKLLENQVLEAVAWAVGRCPELRVVNISLGNDKEEMYYTRRQYPLAEIVDELARQHGLVFTISTGNYEWKEGDEYALYLAEDHRRVKIVNPASAATALTVGSHYLAEKLENNGQATLFPIEQQQPSPFTRSGPGVNGIVKPELLAFGGQGLGGEGGTGSTPEKNVVVAHWQYIDDNRLFAYSSGTSLAAPLVAHAIAVASIANPQAGPNLLRCLALSSARLPEKDKRPEPFNTVDWNGTVQHARTLLNTYGWGIFDASKAAFSDDDRVVLTAESAIDLDGIHVYPLKLPESFLRGTGERTVRVCLAFSPEVNRNRVHYFGNNLEIALFHDVAPQAVLAALSQQDPDDEDDVPYALKNKQVASIPSVSVTKKGANQRTEKMFKNASGWDVAKPLVLAIKSRNRWMDGDAGAEAYAVIVEVEQPGATALYAEVQAINTVQIETTVETKIKV